jgi:DNA polymerase
MEAGCEAILWKDPKTIEFLYGPVMGHLSSCARGAICAAPGRDLIVADYSAVEARDVFWLAKDAAGLEAFRASDAGEGPEVYCIMAEQIFGYPVDPSMEKERFVGKQTILGAGYGMGPDKYLDTCLKYGIRLPDDICKKAIGTYRDVHDPVKTMWAEQEAGAKLAVREKGRVITVGRVQWAVRGRFLHCKLPSGRLLSYYKPMLSTMLNFRFKVNKGDRLGTFSCNQKIRSSGSEGQAHKAARHRAEMVCKEMHWELTEDRPFVREQIVLRFYGQDSKTKKWKIHETYGGKLVENITQAVARDQLADSMVRMDAGGVYMMLLSVHDETVAEVDEGAGDLKEFEREMAVCSDWCADAPLVAKGWRGKRYRKA